MSKHRATGRPEHVVHREPTTPAMGGQQPGGRRRRVRPSPARRRPPVLALAGISVVALGASAAVASQPNDILTAARPASDSFSPAAQVDTADARAALLDRASGVSRSQQRAADDAVQEATEIARARQTALRSLAQRAVARSTYLTENRWVLPMTGYRITATFGQSSYLWSTVHTGVDLAAATGVPIATVGAGEVVSAGYDGSYGNKVVVRHDDGTETWYAHMDSIGVTTGQQVEAGQGVGTVGSTGNVTGPHLHLEFRPGGGAPVDPQTALAALGVLL